MTTEGFLLPKIASPAKGGYDKAPNMDNYYDNAGFRLPPWTRGVKWLIISTIAAFVAQSLIDMMTGGWMTALFGLNRLAVTQLWLWQFVTYIFLHSLGIWHILFNMLGLYFFGRDIEDLFGTARFVIFYLLCGIVGGIAWLALNPAGVCIGASGSVFGLLAAYAALFPQNRITFLFMLIIPISVKARTLAIGLGAITLFLLVVGDRDIAHAAHLAGGVAGYLYGMFLRKRKESYLMGGLLAAQPLFGGLFRKMRDYMARRRSRIRELRNDDWVPEKAEVDRILDKISKSGMGSLTNTERRILDQASRNGTRQGEKDEG